MKRLMIAVLGFASVAALLASHGSSIRAQPVASITMLHPGATVDLYPGCNNITLTFPDATSSETVVQAVTPTSAVEAMWRHDAALSKWDGFSPAAPAASDLQTVDFWDAVWLCVTGRPLPATPTATPVAPPVPTPEGFAHYEGECFAFDYPAGWHLATEHCADPHPCYVESVTVGKLDAPTDCPTWDMEPGDVRIIVSAYGLFPHGICEDMEDCSDVEIDGVTTAVCVGSYEYPPFPSVALACTSFTRANTTLHVMAGSAELNPDWAVLWDLLDSLELRDCAPACWCDAFC